MIFILGHHMILNYWDLDLELKNQVEEIFFLNANKIFSNIEEKERFKSKWLGPYFEKDSIFRCKNINNKIVGYINGKKESIDLPIEFLSLAQKFPEHLHINIHPEYQNEGIGKILMDDFCQVLAQSNCIGVNIVTAPSSRNVKFYERNNFNFSQLSSCKKYLFMGRRLI